MDPLFPQITEDFTALDSDAIEAYITDVLATVDNVSASPSEYVGNDRTFANLLAETSAAVATLDAARAELASRANIAEIDADAIAALATRAHAVPEPEVVIEASIAETEPEPDEEPADEPVEPEAIVAAAPAPVAARPPLPTQARRAIAKVETNAVALTAAASIGGIADMGQEVNMLQVASMIEKRRSQFGNIPSGTRGEKMALARADWRDQYPPERTLGKDEMHNAALVAAANNPSIIAANMADRRAKSLTASGGLCAPVTPYYNLQMISQADRPVRGALTSFNADRGGIRYAAPASLSDVTTGVGVKTAAQDAAGGTEADKGCQVVACPPFSETDVQIIYHCLQFGNLGARTFPERVAQWTSLVLAAHARTAETQLLTGIDNASTAVTAGALGLGASATLFSQILAAANGMRSRNRMDPMAVLRIMLPEWAPDLIISDVIRTQFQRFDTDRQRVVALLRSFNIEPTLYQDTPTGGAQVFGAQTPGALLPFPSDVIWYLYPEGSFLFLDGGTLELGVVRDSILNSTNDFQIFGETFENVAFVGVESLAVTSTTCDSGTVSLPDSVTCPINYNS